MQRGSKDLAWYLLSPRKLQISMLGGQPPEAARELEENGPSVASGAVAVDPLVGKSFRHTLDVLDEGMVVRGRFEGDLTITRAHPSVSGAYECSFTHHGKSMTSVIAEEVIAATIAAQEQPSSPPPSPPLSLPYLQTY